MSMVHHESAKADTVSWITPPELVRALGTFDLDPCQSDPQPWPFATRAYTLPQDGLRLPWDGRVWLNPPYGLAVKHWLSKMASHRHGTALIFARTETRAFQRWVFGEADAILFLAGRIRFYRPDGTLPPRRNGSGGGGAPSCLVAYGSADAWKLRCSHLPGAFTESWRRP